MQLGGIHHVTAISGDVSMNVAFYTQVLGMHLVKQSVNQDDVSAYHLFYGDDIGHAGTELTFFDWPAAGLNRSGAGSISAIALGVNGREALDWWVERLDAFHVAHDPIQVRSYNNRAFLAFRDPEGQHLELVDDGGKLQSVPWRKSPVPADKAIRGLYAVRLIERRIESTESFLTGALGFRRSGMYESEEGTTVQVFEVGPGGAGTEVHVDVRSNKPDGRSGIGGVHHVAFRTPDEEEQVRWREQISQSVGQVTPVIDRFYFHSIYFREPGGVLFEIATDGPGFTADEDSEHLGERLALPPFLEPQRARIEEGIRPIIPFKLAALGQTLS